MDLDDLDSFIANIEETAPKENITSDKLTCQECGAELEEVDEIYVCPNCSVQATNILQLDETELNYDESGRAIVGQRVKTFERKSKHSVDYGWAWSTDDAVVHILSLQITALEKAKLIPDSFRDAISNMWFKFWLENVAPYIKDEYEDNELVPINVSKALKLRDIEVLVKVKDKVMIPSRLMNQSNAKRRSYKAMGLSFNETRQLSHSESSNSIETDSSDGVERISVNENDDQQLAEDDDKASSSVVDVAIENLPEDSSQPRTITTNLSRDTISILTLNRTLAFIEATARCTGKDDPLFAADIIRACNQYLIPFYGAYKDLPEGMNLNPRDKLMFQRTRPPTPIQLTRTASLLIHKIYHDRFPTYLPVPNFTKILERFMRDMNLPMELFDAIKHKVTFANFSQTKPMRLDNSKISRLPQYDRWVFAILLGHLKSLFNLNDEIIREQSQQAQNRSITSGQDVFVFGDWIQQMSIKLKIILSYDPFVLFHPLTIVEKLETTPQVYEYIDTILTNRVITTTRLEPNLPRYDPAFREELTQFLLSEMPKLADLDKSIFDREELDKSEDVKYPITDSIKRTRRFWSSEAQKDDGILDLIDRDFTHSKMCFSSDQPRWCIYEGTERSSRSLDVLDRWPESYKLLLSVGSFLCFCEPKELLNEVRMVEEFFHPNAKVIKRRSIARSNADRSVGLHM